jgi:hypothetical protein
VTARLGPGELHDGNADLAPGHHLHFLGLARVWIGNGRGGLVPIRPGHPRQSFVRPGFGERQGCNLE